MIRVRARAGCWQSCGAPKRSSARYRRVGCMMPAKCLNRDEPRNEGGEGEGERKGERFRWSEENQRAIKQTNGDKMLRMSGKARSKVGECVANEGVVCDRATEGNNKKL